MMGMFYLSLVEQIREKEGVGFTLKKNLFLF